MKSKYYLSKDDLKTVKATKIMLLESLSWDIEEALAAFRKGKTEQKIVLVLTTKKGG